MPPLAAILQADAFALPFRDEAFEVVVADPPYAGKNRGRIGRPTGASGYVGYCGDAWWAEAWRVLRPSGSLYCFSAVREVRRWMTAIQEPPVDLLAWLAPNNLGFRQFATPHRVASWRPILHWQKPPCAPFDWRGLPRYYTLSDCSVVNERGVGNHADPNCFITAAVQRHMHEAEPWPNQLPVALLRWLLRPHQGAKVLDLFSGTGTTRVACVDLAMDVVSVDLAPQAVVLTARRPAQMGMV